MSRVIVAGSVNVDLTTYLDRWPDVGETIRARETSISLGGKGANQAVAAARAGAQVTLIGAIGADVFGAQMSGMLASEGIELCLQDLEDVASGMAFIDVGPDGGNIIRLSAGANDAVGQTLIRAHESAFADARVLLLQNEVPLEAATEAASIARERGTLVVMDPAPAPNPMWGKDTLAQFDILTPNAHETRLILGHEPCTLEDAENAARALANFARRGAIVTMGEKGAAWCIDGATGQHAAPRVDTIDTVGAGDCFNGAFAAACAEGMNIVKALSFALHAAALATTGLGASVAMPSRLNIEEFWRNSEPTTGL